MRTPLKVTPCGALSGVGLHQQHGGDRDLYSGRDSFAAFEPFHASFNAVVLVFFRHVRSRGRFERFLGVGYAHLALAVVERPMVVVIPPDADLILRRCCGGRAERAYVTLAGVATTVTS